MKRDRTIDIIRVFGLIWVMLIHSIFWMNYNFFGTFYQILMTLLLIEMPIMFFAAGASNYKSRSTSVLGFYKKRLQRIILPYVGYLFFCVIIVMIISYIKRDGLGIEAFRLNAWYNFFSLGIPLKNSSYVMYALWFVPVYLAVMLAVPWLRQMHVSSSKLSNNYRYTILGLLIMVFLAFSYLKLDFLTNVSFYLIWTYIGFFYDKINFESVNGKKKHLLIGGGIVIAMLISNRVNLSILNMQLNKFPPNYLFMIYSIAVMNILYYLAPFMISRAKQLLSKSIFWQKMLEVYNTKGYTIYLYHPLSFILVDAFLYTIDPNIYLRKYPLLRSLIYFVAVILINPVWAKVFGWTEDLKLELSMKKLLFSFRSKIKRLFFTVYHLVVMGVLGLGAYLLLTEQANGLYKLSGFVIILSALWTIRKVIAKIDIPLTDKWDWLWLVLFTVVLRAIFLAFAKMEQFSDYQNYFDSGVMLANGELIPNLVKYITIFKHILGYAMFLAGIFVLFGTNVLIAQWANILLASVSVVLLYKITCHFFSRKTAFFAGLAYAFFPSNIMFTPLLFQGYLTCCLLLLAFYIYLCRYFKYKYIAVGLVLGLMEITRPLAIILIIAIILYELLLKPDLSKTVYKNLIVMTLVFLMLPFTFYKIMSHKLQSNTAGLSYFTLFVGISEEGHWTIEDSNVMGEYMFEPTLFGKNYQYHQARLRPEVAGINGAQIVQNHMKQEFINRVKNRNFGVSFFFNKIRFMWASDTTPIYVPKKSNFLIRHQKIIAYLTNLYYWLGLICLVIVVGFGLMYKRSNPLLMLTWLFMAGFMAVHIITEVAPRYHFMIIPFLSLSIALVISKDYKRSNMVKTVVF